ncbi:uracil-DNA glycosylase [Bacillus sp. T33-2]|uniref:uracil-DNA glycosylase n=1 Tax=Bacillus sp. T33-2 TaxID=2054168 RepID=UPI000C777190|nr:uracil-DNA glycosylase [Bacillus sp. T33-2]PLR96643.1 uracil-DNA glycosylase [Bacillus sp. T33-2]
MIPVLGNRWDSLLAEEFQKPYFQQLQNFLDAEYASHTVYPERENIFNALKYTDFQDVKIVLLGQDPYHGPDQAHGLSFSVKPQVDIPPSLKNIFKELHNDLGLSVPNNGYLKKWAGQGVLLLNTVLTVRKGKANSHRGKGWEIFTDRVITCLSEREEPVIFMLWGKPAQNKLKLIDTSRHFIISSAHPSPLSARKGFFGSSPFSTANQYLRTLGQKEIDWQIEDVDK